MFAKIFNPPEGQIVVMLRLGDDDGLEIRAFTKPPGMDVCETAVSFKEGRDQEAQKAFDDMTETQASQMVASLHESAKFFQ